MRYSPLFLFTVPLSCALWTKRAVHAGNMKTTTVYFYYLQRSPAEAASLYYFYCQTEKKDLLTCSRAPLLLFISKPRTMHCNTLQQRLGVVFFQEKGGSSFWSNYLYDCNEYPQGATFTCKLFFFREKQSGWCDSQKIPKLIRQPWFDKAKCFVGKKNSFFFIHMGWLFFFSIYIFFSISLS